MDALTCMSALEFLDTNVLVYAYDTGDVVKRDIARALLRQALAGEMMISSQVLAEFSVTLIHKISPAASAEDLLTMLDALAPIKLVPIDGNVVRLCSPGTRENMAYISTTG